MFPGDPRVPRYGIPVHLHQPAGLSHATAFRNVAQQRNHFRRRQLRAEPRRAFAFGKSFLTRAAIQQANLAVLSKPVTDRQVSRSPFTVRRTLGILTTKSRKIFHDSDPQNTTPLNKSYVGEVGEVGRIYSISAIIAGHEALFCGERILSSFCFRLARLHMTGPVHALLLPSTD